MVDLQQKVSVLEIKVTHQEQQINDLSQMVTDQWKILDKLKSTLTKTDARLQSLENNNPEASSGVSYEKPPHYQKREYK